MSIFPTLPPFIGGEEKTFHVRFEEDDVVLDLEDWTYRVEIIWDGCTHICLTEGDGITRLSDEPDPEAAATDDQFHFSWTLTEEQTEEVPVGKSQVNISRISPTDVTWIDSVDLKRAR